MKTLPNSVSDFLMHGKDSDRTERILMPITRYDNIISAPKVVTEDLDSVGAPFYLMKTGSTILTTEEIRNLYGEIV